MKLKTISRAIVIACALMATGFAAVPLIVPHQGRLLDSDDQPVSGQRDLTFRIFETVTGGSALWTELHSDVPVNDGLFSVMLGSTVTISGDLVVTSGTFETERYLEVQVETDAPLVPRMRIGSAPLAIASSRVSGDITTSPGSMAIGDLNGDGRLDVVCATDLSSINIQDSDASGSSSLKGVVSGDSPGTTNLAGLYLDCDDDGDFVPDAEVSLESSKNGLTVKGSLTMSAGDATRIFDAESDPVDVTLEMRAKPVNSGDNENWIFGGASSVGASHLVAADFDQDGLEDLAVSSRVTSVGGSLSIQAGELELGSTTSLFSVTGQPTPIGEVGEISLRMSVDSGGNGKSEYEVDVDCGGPAENARLKLFVDKNGDGTINGSQEFNVSPGGLISDWSWDIEADNFTDRRITAECNDEDAGISILAGVAIPKFIDITAHGQTAAQQADVSMVLGSGPDTTIELYSDDNNNRISIVSLPDGGTVVAGKMELATSPTGVSHTFSWDSNADGVIDQAVGEVCDDNNSGEEFTAGVAIPKFINVTARDNNSTGVADVSMVMGLGPDTTIELHADAGSSRMRLDGPAGEAVNELNDVNAKFFLSHDKELDGAVDRTFSNICNDDGASLAILAGVAIPKFINITAEAKTAAEIGDVSMVMGQGPDTGIDLRVKPIMSNFKVYYQQRQVSITTDSSGGRVAIDTIPTTHTLSIGGGGAFCDGTTWTNASDKNAKENFSEVDGEELLEKIEELSITQWNYKSEGESVTHIGPTAQDFKKAFGVGSDDKSISTVDPSGIALAAIKELNKQNQDLANQNKELQKQLDDLKKKVNELISRR